MYSINDNNISLTRGDTFIAQLHIKEKSNDYIPATEDVICFALKRNIMDNKRERYIDKEPLITKIISNDDLILRIDSEDTKDLPFGRYAYEIELTRENGIVDTFISGIFTLTPEVK